MDIKAYLEQKGYDVNEYYEPPVLNDIGRTLVELITKQRELEARIITLEGGGESA